MLGPAELHEINEALNKERGEVERPLGRSPYVTPHFAVGVAMTRAATAGMKLHKLPNLAFKR